MQRISPRDSAGFRMFAASSEPSADPAPHQRVQLVDEHDDVRVLDQLLHDRLEAFLELPAVLCAGHDQRDVEREQPLVRQKVRNVAESDALGQPLDDGRLADPGLADEHGVVLRPAAQHLLHPLELHGAAHQRVEPILHRGVRQVAAELGQQRRLLYAGHRGLLVEELHDVLADRVQPHPLLGQDGRRHGALLAQDAEQQMLRPDVVVEQPVRLLGGELQHALGLGAERDLDRRGHLLAEDGAPFDFLADVLERQARAGEDAARQSLALANQTEQQVLGLDRDAAELARLVAREEQDTPRARSVYRSNMSTAPTRGGQSSRLCIDYKVPAAPATRTAEAGRVKPRKAPRRRAAARGSHAAGQPLVVGGDDRRQAVRAVHVRAAVRGSPRRSSRRPDRRSGSSASSSAGAHHKGARHGHTRCCSPPDSMPGRCARRSPRPTSRNSASARAGRTPPASAARCASASRRSPGRRTPAAGDGAGRRTRRAGS